jgi:hypothetical protein
MIDVIQYFYGLLLKSIGVFMVLFIIALLILFVFFIIAIIVYFRLNYDKAF